MVAPILPKVAFRPLRPGTLPGGPNFGTNKLATEALVKAMSPHSASAIRTMAAPQLASTLRAVNASFEGHLGKNSSLMRGSSHEFVAAIPGTSEARPVLNALEYRRTELAAEIEKTDAPGGHDTRMSTLMSNQYLAKFHWDELGSKVYHASAELAMSYSFNPKSDPQYQSIMARLGKLNLTADHNSSYSGAQKLGVHLRPLVDEMTTFIAPFKASGWSAPSAPQKAIEQLRAVRDQLSQTLALLDQHTALIDARPPSFLID